MHCGVIFFGVVKTEGEGVDWWGRVEWSVWQVVWVGVQ